MSEPKTFLRSSDQRWSMLNRTHLVGALFALRTLRTNESFKPNERTTRILEGHISEVSGEIERRNSIDSPHADLFTPAP